MYRLVGHLSYIDKYNKLKFTWLDDNDTNSSNETRNKLTRLCSNDTNLPYNDEGFTVTIQGNKHTPLDIIEKIGLDMTIYVKPQAFKFISKLEHNKGALITGHTLFLNKI